MPEFKEWEAAATPGLRLAFIREVSSQIGLQLFPSFSIDQFTADDIAGFCVKVKSLDWRSMESNWL